MPKTMRAWSLNHPDHQENSCARYSVSFGPGVGKLPWRRERLPTPAFWPGEFQGLYGPWGHRESDATERLSLASKRDFIWE